MDHSDLWGPIEDESYLRGVDFRVEKTDEVVRKSLSGLLRIVMTLKKNLYYT